MNARARPDVAQSPPDLGRLVAGVRLLTALVSGLPMFVLAIPALGPAPALAVGSLCAMAGSRAPDLALASAGRRALRSASTDAAAAIDMLAATASAGLSLQEAMVMTAGHAPPAIAAVLQAAAIRRALGEEPRQAVGTEAVRYGVPVLADVAEAIERQRRLGVALGPELTRIATRLRAEQRTKALQRAARRGPLATLVVALVIAPACLAAIVACLLGGLLQGGGLAIG